MSDYQRPFITGSRAYGSPSEDSDLDIVIRCDRYIAAVVESLIGRSTSDYDHESVSVQCGQVNLHLCTTDREYDRWKLGTRSCEVVAPVDRETAKKLLRVAGVDRGEDLEVSAYSTRGPGKLPAITDGGTVTPIRQWMGWDKMQ